MEELGLDQDFLDALNDSRIDADPSSLLPPEEGSEKTEEKSSDDEDSFPIEDESRPSLYEWVDREEEDEDEFEEAEIMDEDEGSYDRSSDDESFEDDFDSWGELVVGWLENLKETVNNTAVDLFHKKIEERFSKEDQELIHALLYLDAQESLGKHSKEELKEWAEEYGVPFKKMISTWVKYTDIRKRYQTSSIKEWEKEGIAKYSQRVIQKYLQFNRIPDELMLILFLGPTAMEIGRVFYMQYQDNKRKKKKK